MSSHMYVHAYEYKTKSLLLLYVAKRLILSYNSWNYRSFFCNVGECVCFFITFVMILLPLRVVIQSRRSVHLVASHSLTLLTLWYKSMHKHVLYNDRRIVWICFAWQKQNESSTSFSNLGRYFHTCMHTYIRMYVCMCVRVYVCIYST